MREEAGFVPEEVVVACRRFRLLDCQCAASDPGIPDFTDSSD